jgi:hypothetical protein
VRLFADIAMLDEANMQPGWTKHVDDRTNVMAVTASIFTANVLSDTTSIQLHENTPK